MSDGVYSFLRTWLAGFAALGLNPVKPERQEPTAVVFRVSNIRRAVGETYIVLFLAAIIVQILTTDISKDSLAVGLLQCYLYYTSLLTPLTLVLSALCKATDYKKLLQQLTDIEIPRDDFEPRCITSPLKIILCVSFPILIFSFIADIVQYSDNRVSIIHCTVVHVFLVIILVSLVQFANCTLWLRKVLADLFCRLSHLEKHLSGSSAGQMKVVSKGNSMFHAICDMRRSYEKARHVAELINQTFSTRVMFSMAANLTMATLEVYYCMICLVTLTTRPGPLALADFLFYMRQFIFSSLSILGYIRSSTVVYNEVYKINTKIHEIGLEISDPRQMIEIKLFMLQMNEPIRFSPHGVYTLSNGLFLSICGALTSYFVILLQFRKAF